RGNTKAACGTRGSRLHPSGAAGPAQARRASPTPAHKSSPHTKAARRLSLCPAAPGRAVRLVLICRCFLPLLACTEHPPLLGTFYVPAGARYALGVICPGGRTGSGAAGQTGPWAPLSPPGPSRQGAARGQRVLLPGGPAPGREPGPAAERVQAGARVQPAPGGPEPPAGRLAPAGAFRAGAAVLRPALPAQRLPGPRRKHGRGSSRPGTGRTSPSGC